ncbi:MAG: lipase family protein [Gordonia sp. (in: high G+C Gram-positive bacteria)]|uniref:lipase family protein n=1 Tax=Gordonia sp. (in: high G+C Gram-positive bacteria) TaxID=84139 RepID=UPI0039E5222A
MKRLLTRAATAAAALAVTVAGVSVVDAAAGASPAPNRTPGLNEIFNGYVISTLRDGRVGSPEEILKPMLPGDPFYREPRLKPSDKPGTLLKAQKVAVQFMGVQPAHLDAWKTMFVTTDLKGNRDISTGIIMIPRDGEKNSERKVLGYQMANDSVGAYCHPSSMWPGGDQIDGALWSALGPLALLFERGYAIVMSDVGNSGDPKPHGVFAGKYNGMTTLDGLRAAMSFDKAGLSRDASVGLFGIAGGGVGTGFASQLAADYAPELKIKASVLEGMVPNYKNFIRTTDGSVGSAFALATILGLEPHYPEMQVDKHLNPAGKAIADVYRTQCQSPAYFTLPFVPMRTLFNGQNPADIPAFQRAYRENILGRDGFPPAGSRTLVASCAADDSPMSLVPAADSRKLVRDWRSKGATVDYQPTDCSMVHMLTDLYGWGTDLFGMETIDWLDKTMKG